MPSRIGGSRARIGDAPVFASCGRNSVAVQEAIAKFTARACVDTVSVTFCNFCDKINSASERPYIIKIALNCAEIETQSKLTA